MARSGLIRHGIEAEKVGRVTPDFALEKEKILLHEQGALQCRGAWVEEAGRENHVPLPHALNGEGAGHVIVQGISSGIVTQEIE